MSTADTPVRGSFRGLSDLPLVARQVGFEQLSFWLNPIGAVLTIGFSRRFVVIFLSTSRHSTVNYLPLQSRRSTTSRLSRPTESWPPASTSWPSAWSIAARWVCSSGSV